MVGRHSHGPFGLKVIFFKAALGANVEAELADGSVKLKIPPGSQSGARMRLRGKGLRSTKTERGDLIVELEVCVPQELTSDERRLMEELRRVSKFNPRSEGAR